MSVLNVTAFCKYIENNIIHDNNTNFIIADGIDISKLISPKPSAISITAFINDLFESTIIRCEYFEEVILHVINCLNYLKTNGIYLNNLNSHRILLILLLLACKISDDEPYDNSQWANLIGIDIKEINDMEISILKLFKFDLLILISQQKALSICKSIY